MADARYVIDLILKAHDDSAAAFASLIGNQKAFEEQTKHTQEQAEKSNRALEDSNRSLKQTYSDLKNSQDAHLLRLKGVAEAQVELEKSSRNLAKTNQDENATLAEKQAALQRNTEAYKGLTKVLKDKSELDQQQIRAHADNVKGIQFEIERLEAQKKKLEELGAAETRIARVRDQIRQQQIQADRAVGQEQQRITQQRQRDQDALTQTLRRQAQELGKQDVGAAKYEELSKNIAHTRQELARLTGDSRTALQEQKKALDDAGVSIDKNSKAYVNQRQAIRENTTAIDAYERAVQNAARAHENLSKATGDQKVRFQFEVDERTKAAVFAAKALAGKDVHVNVEADIKEASFAKVMAAKAVLGKNVRFKVDADAAPALRALASIGNSIGHMSDNLGTKIAQFDNVIRGAFSLLTAVFLPQLVILAGAAAGALLSLGSSATFAAGALGGSLVAGIGQALPVLGVLVAALTRVKNVFNAVKQANLLQQQQSYKGAAQARTSAAAENTLTNALETQKQAHEAIIDAQKRVTEARAEAIRKTEDLIFAEKRASLSVGEAEDALRQAIQSGQAGEIESRRLDLQEAQVRAQRAREDATQGRRTGDPGGNVANAVKSLKDAEVAAGRASRAVENAKHSSEGAAAGVTAAAGKLAFLQSQMSKSERALYTALTTLQTRFRAFAKDISSPLIDSFTDATKKMTALLGDDRIISATRGLSRAMAREFSKTTDAFTSGRPLRQQIQLTKEATRNMEFFGRFSRAAGKILLDIAQAASPVFRRLSRFIAEGAENLQKFTGSKQGQKELTEFFKQGIVHLKAWIDLFGSIIHLFAAIAGEGGGAKTGLKLIRDLTNSINEFGDSIEKKGSKSHKFFADLFTVTRIVGKQLGPVLKAIADQLSDIFGDESKSGGKSVKAFGSILSEILIPAFGIFLRNMLVLNRIFASLPGPVKTLLALFIGWSLTFGVLGKLFTILLGTLFKGIFILIRAFQILRTLIAITWATALGPVALIVAGVLILIGIIYLLDRKFHFLKPTIHAVWGALKTIFNWVKENWDLLLPLLLGPFGFIFIALRRIHGLKDGIVDIFGKILDFLKGIPGAFADAGKAIGNALWGAVKTVGQAFIDFFVLEINGLLKIINKAIDAYNAIPLAPDIGNIGYVKAPKFQKGGPVGGYGGGDVVTALLEPGEHVWTKEEVAQAGGHGIMYALRSFFGGGGQAYGRGYAVGGTVRPGAAGSAEGIAAVDLSSLLRIIEAASGKILTAWKEMWAKLNELTKSGRNDIRTIFRAIADIVERQMENAKDTATKKAQQLRRNVLDQFEDMDKGVFKGLRYVARNVNNALDAFGAKPTKINIDTPPGLATGGWIGAPGERGRDMIPTVLGRGEAVLNWGHQKIVNSALWNQYGTTLDGMFKRTAGYHAGGAGIGMAGGGFTGPHGSGEGFNPIANFAMSKFGLQMTAGRTDHSYYTSSGNVSDHSRGLAGDFSNGVLTPQEDAFSNFWKNKATQTIKQLIWRGMDQLGGFPIEDHTDHVHLAVLPQYAFNAARIAKIISRASRGLSIAELLAGGTTDVDHLDKIKVKGEGSLATLTKSVLDKLVKFANKYIDKIASRLAPGFPGTAHYDGPLDHTFGDMNTTISFDQAVGLAKRAGFSAHDAQLFGHIAVSESGLRPGVVNSIGATGLWQIYNHPDLVAKYGDMRNPWNNARAAFELFRSGGTGPWVSSIAGWGQFAAQGGFPSFAVGGIVPGQQAGQSTLIEAHAGEWVVNQAQQSKLAGLVGATAGKLRDFLGFTGGPTSFQGGGTVTSFSTVREQAAAARRGEVLFNVPLRTFAEIRAAYDQAMHALRSAATQIKGSIHAKTEKYLKALLAITGENGLLDILSERIERHTKQMATELLRSQFSVIRGKGKKHRIIGVRGTGKSEEDLAEEAIENQLKTLNELNRYSLEVRRIIESIKKQDDRLRERIRNLRKGKVTPEDLEKIGKLQDQRQLLKTSLSEEQDRLQGIRDAIAEQIKAIFDARTAQIEHLAQESGRSVEIADLWSRLLQAIGIGAAGAIQNRINALHTQLTNLQEALRQAQKLGNAALVQDIQDQINEISVTLFEAQMELIRTTAEEAIKAAERLTTQRSIALRIAEVLGQNTWQAQMQVINSLKWQITVIQSQIRAALAGGNIGLANELQDSLLDLQATLVEATQTLFQTVIDGVNEAARKAQFQIDLRNRLADLMEQGGDAIGAAQLREQILAAQGVNLTNVMLSLQSLLNKQLALPVNEQNQIFITQLTEQIQDLNVQVQENTLALQNAANATREAMIAAINEPAQFQTGIFGQLSSILQSITNITGTSTLGQQQGTLDQIGTILSTQGDALRQQLLSWLGINLLGLSGTNFVTAIAALDFNTLTLGMTAAEKSTFEALINSIVENQLQLQQNTEALNALGDTLAPQDFTSTAWQWLRQAIFSGAGGLLPQFQTPGLQEGGTVLRTGMALVHEGEWWMNPSGNKLPSNMGTDHIEVTINEAGQPLDVQALVSRLTFERQGRRR